MATKIKIENGIASTMEGVPIENFMDFLTNGGKVRVSKSLIKDGTYELPDEWKVKIEYWCRKDAFKEDWVLSNEVTYNDFYGTPYVKQTARLVRKENKIEVLPSEDSVKLNLNQIYPSELKELSDKFFAIIPLDNPELSDEIARACALLHIQLVRKETHQHLPTIEAFEEAGVFKSYGDCHKPLIEVRPGKYQCNNPECIRNKKENSAHA